MLRPLYPIMYICTSRIASFYAPCNLRNLISLFWCRATDSFAYEKPSGMLLSFFHRKHYYLHQQIAMWSPVHTVKRCCYMNYMCEGELRIKHYNFLAVYPAVRPPLTYVRPLLTKTKHTLCVRSQDILLLKWTKHQLSIYGKMPIVNGFSKACVTFQSSSCPIQEERFEI